MAHASIEKVVITEPVFEQDITLSLTRKEAIALHALTGKTVGTLLYGVYSALDGLNICARVTGQESTPVIDLLAWEVTLDEITSED